MRFSIRQLLIAIFVAAFVMAFQIRTVNNFVVFVSVGAAAAIAYGYVTQVRRWMQYRAIGQGDHSILVDTLLLLGLLILASAPISAGILVLSWLK